MFPVFFSGRKCGRHPLLRSVFISIWTIADTALAGSVGAQTATSVAQTAQAQATQDQKNLPPIRVSGNKPKSRGNVRKPYPGAQVHAAPNPVRTPPIPGNVTGPIPNNSVTNPLSGIPATPLNAVATSASRLGLPVIETPASVDIVTAQTIQDQGYRTTTDTAQGAVGVLSGDAGNARRGANRGTSRASGASDARSKKSAADSRLR